MTGTRHPRHDERDDTADPIGLPGRRPAARARGASWSSGHRGAEYRLIMIVVIGLCAAGAAGVVVPGLDTAIGAVLAAAAFGAVAVVAVRRELRIRRRIADTDGTLRLRRPAAGVTELRVGPGDATPDPLASTARADHPLHPVPGHLAAVSPAATHARLFTPSGGVA